MELSCYGFELRHSGIPVVWPFGTARIAFEVLLVHRGTGLAFTWALAYHKMGTRGG